MSAKNTEIIAMASGKGGTGKTSLSTALGYALTYSGFDVLLIDADPATDGFSLFILGPNGMNQIGDYKPENTFTGYLQEFERNPSAQAVPRNVHRIGSDDHDITYKWTLISGKGLYGAVPTAERTTAGTPLGAGAFRPETNIVQMTRPRFREAMLSLCAQVRGKFDYVLIDTRGGFSFESTDVCAIADSFIVVTEANYTSFFQDRNLVTRISEAATEMQTKTVLRAIIVNKATQGEELSFRAALVQEFGIRMEDTFPVALDFDAVKVYKTQQVIYKRAPASQFAFDSLRAFSDILKVVTAQWSEEQIKKWNEIVETVKKAIAEHNKKIADDEAQMQQTLQQYGAIQTENLRLKSDLENSKTLLDQAKTSSNELLETLKKQHAQTEQALQNERAAAERRAKEKEEELAKAAKSQEERIEYLTARKVYEQEKILNEYKSFSETLRLRARMISIGTAAAAMVFGGWLLTEKIEEQRFRSWAPDRADELKTYSGKVARAADAAWGNAIESHDITIDRWRETTQAQWRGTATALRMLIETNRTAGAQLEALIENAQGGKEKLLPASIETQLISISKRLALAGSNMNQEIMSQDRLETLSRVELEEYKRRVHASLEAFRQQLKEALAALEGGLQLQKELLESGNGNKEAYDKKLQPLTEGLKKALSEMEAAVIAAMPDSRGLMQKTK